MIDANAGPIVIVPDYVLTYAFDEYVPAGSYVYVNDSWTMTAGKYVQGYLANSGGHNVYMTVVDASTHQALGSEILFDQEGTTKTLWTNTSGTTKYVTFKLRITWVFSEVHATGNFVFGWF